MGRSITDCAFEYGKLSKIDLTEVSAGAEDNDRGGKRARDCVVESAKPAFLRQKLARDAGGHIECSAMP
jgi:hypothetical protein